MTANEFHSTTKSFLEWGRLSLIHYPGEQVFSENLENRIFSQKDLDRHLRHDLDQIVKNAREALDCLRQPEVLYIVDDDPSWNQALKAFERLDHLVRFIEAAEKLLSQKDDQLSDELLTVAADAYDQVSTFFFSPDYSALRLTLFQEHRKKALEDIHPEQQYLFPWYELYIHIEPDALPLIAENLYCPENLPEEIKGHIPLFLADIQTDKVLSNYIQEQQLFSKDLTSILQTHWSLRLLRFVEQINLDKVLPEMVEQKGVARLSRSLEQGSKLSAQDRFALGLSVALFVPDIDEAERLKLLAECENVFEQVKQASRPDNSAGRVIQKLNNFHIGRTTLEEAVQSTLDYWIDQLSTVQAEDRKSKSDMVKLANILLQAEGTSTAGFNDFRQQGKGNGDQKVKAGSWTDKLKSFFGKPVVFVPALAVLLIMISVPFVTRHQDPIHMNLEMLVYQSQPLTRSDETETVMVKESGAILSSQDCFQLLFTPTRDIYAYLLHQNTQGQVAKYFEGQLYKDQTTIFPDEDSRACFTEDSGSEVFYLIYSDDAVDGFNELTARLSFVEGQLESEIRVKFPDAQIEKFTFSYK